MPLRDSEKPHATKHWTGRGNSPSRTVIGTMVVDLAQYRDGLDPASSGNAAIAGAEPTAHTRWKPAKGWTDGRAWVGHQSCRLTHRISRPFDRPFDAGSP
jgi:hypothetical protein